MALRRPVVAARSRSFLAPGTVTAERLTDLGNGYMGALPDPNADAPGWILTVDAILFSDGELVGPDTLHLGEIIVVRKAAATKVTTALRQAAANHADVAAVLDELTGIPSEFRTSPPSAQAVMELNEVRRMARDLQFHQNDSQRFEMQIRYLETLPVPVEICRAGER